MLIYEIVTPKKIRKKKCIFFKVLKPAFSIFLIAFLIFQVLVGIFLFFSVEDVRADTLTLYPTADSRVAAQAPTTNYGTDALIAVQALDSSNRQRPLIQFDLSSIPAGSTINSATFSAYYYSYYAGGLDPVGRTYYLNRITASWIETGVTWNNQPASTTTNRASVVMPASFGWVNWNVQSIVNDWINNGAANYGFLMYDYNETGGVNKLAIFYSREYTGTSYDPKLVIDYTPPNVAPSAPQTPWCEGQTSPVTDMADFTPEFSAIFDDPDTSNHADYYEIEVGTDADWGVAEMWDTGQTANADQTLENSRCADISYAGSTLTGGNTYYWRMRFWDNYNTVGAWSADQQFTMENIPVINSVLDSPDPQVSSSSTSFTSVASDSDIGDTIKLYVCKNADCANCNPTNQVDCWAVSASGSTNNPSATYVCPSCGYATNNYSAKVCDNHDVCSSMTSVQLFTCKKANGCSCTDNDGASDQCYGGYCCDNLCQSDLCGLGVSTNEATSIGTETATLNGNLDDIGGESQVKVWFEWGETDVYGNSTAKQAVNSTGPFSANLSSLTSSQSYHFRAKASRTDDTGVVSGNDSAFTPGDGFVGNHKWAWGENIGWNNFQPTYGGVRVFGEGLVGYIWAENVGWIKLDYDGIPGAENTTATNWGVVNDGSGNLSGYAWGENIGWVNFDPTHAQVIIGDGGYFSGYAWTENVGWIKFDHSQTDYIPQTSWTSSVIPTAPTSLLCEGQTNPTNVTDQTPEFSAIYNDPNAGDIANKYRIQVDDDSEFLSSFWDSGVLGISMTNCSRGNRCTDIVYNGDDFFWNTTYYWRIKFWDDDGNEGLWSAEEAYFSTTSANFETDRKWAWGENIGWNNFQPSNGGVVVADFGLVGYVWAENVGWIKLDYDDVPGAENTTSTNWGVTNDGSGNLSGYAWGENIGWVNFDPTHATITIDSSGNFVGYVWAENVGWIKFDHDQTSYTPKTSWRASVPLISLISDSPDPQEGGSDITFTASGVNDPQSDNVYLYICSTSSYSKCAPDNSEGWLISPTGPFASPYSNVTASKSCTSCTYESDNYWARVCDSNSNCSRIIPAGGAAFNCKKENDCSCSGQSGQSDECYGGWCCKNLCKSECPYADVGYLISSTLDTQITGGVAYNSIMWKGTQPTGTSVKLQLATSSSPDGPWVFYGRSGDSCLTNEFYSAAPDTSVEIRCASIHNNKRYFRYKALLYSDAATHLLTPTVTKVIVNYSP